MATQNKQNSKQLFRQQPHYGLRKLSIGVASVLLSTSFYLGVTAHAATSDNGLMSPVTKNLNQNHLLTQTLVQWFFLTRHLITH